MTADNIVRSRIMRHQPKSNYSTILVPPLLLPIKPPLCDSCESPIFQGPSYNFPRKNSRESTVHLKLRTCLQANTISHNTMQSNNQPKTRYECQCPNS